ncbi:queuosine precursor transporter [Arcanobacterium haemolyticum]|nr:queuosine precursor transporter [Arcanobacterium haemolyticum]
MPADRRESTLTEATAAPVRTAKIPTRGIYDIIAVCFVAFLLLSNIAATKLIEVGVGPLDLVFDGGAILFPLTYILGDVLSEVYGFRFARRTILVGFAVQLVASLTFWLVQIAPPAADYTGQEAFAAVLGVVPRFVAASIIGYLAGQLLNSYVLVKIKERWGEKHLWARLLGSTVVGEAADTALFCLIAWIGVVPFSTILNLMIVGYVYKVGVEAVLLPLTYVVVGWVKRIEAVKGTDEN